MTKRRRRRRGYDNSSPDFRHGELKRRGQRTPDFLDFYFEFRDKK